MKALGRGGRRGDRGFTMLEVLLTLAIGGVIMTAASLLMVTIFRVWTSGPSEKDAFAAHVDGVGRFLDQVLRESTLAPGETGQGEPVFLGRPPGFSELDDPLIAFYLREAPPLLVWPGGLATRVRGYLYFEEDEGLFMLWYSDLQEMERGEDGKLTLEDEEDLFKTPVSEFCEEVLYCYYGEEGADADDLKEWEEKDDLEENVKSDRHRLPDFVKLVFRSRVDEDLERVLTIPVKRISPNGLSLEKR